MSNGNIALLRPPCTNKCKRCGKKLESPNIGKVWSASESRIALEIGAMAISLEKMGWDWHNQICPNCRPK